MFDAEITERTRRKTKLPGDRHTKFTNQIYTSNVPSNLSQWEEKRIQMQDGKPRYQPGTQGLHWRLGTLAGRVGRDVSFHEIGKAANLCKLPYIPDIYHGQRLRPTRARSQTQR